MNAPGDVHYSSKFDPWRNSHSSLHATSIHELTHPHMKFWDFAYRDFSLPLISNIPMLDPAK
jgi:hypothetical protein